VSQAYTTILKKLYFIFLLLFYSNLFSQKLTGTWVGDIDGYEYLQVNIVQVGDNICGYSWDYVYTNKEDYCKSYFTGTRNKMFNTWLLDGYSFMINHFNHSLMQFKLKLEYDAGDTYLIGFLRTRGNLLLSAGDPSEIRLKKVASRPAEMTQEMIDCMKTYEKPKPRIVERPKKEPVKTNLPIVKKPTTKPLTTLPKKIIKDTIVAKKPTIKTLPKENILPTKIEGRTNKELKRIVINEKKLFLNIYDNGTVDGDTISILYNGKTIVSKKRISEKPITVELVLDENSKYHSIVLFAENLGSIPPNTALLIFSTPNGKRYELFASANLQQNAEIIFEYKPD
jgi:hypothetical protein